MGDGVWTSTTAPWGNDFIGSMLAGVDRDADGGKARSATDLEGDAQEKFIKRTTEELPVLGGYDGNTKYALDFGVLREAVLASTRVKDTGETPDHGNVPYWNGPFYNAVKLMEPIWDWALMNQTNFAQGATPTLPVGKAVREVTKPNGALNKNDLKDFMNAWLGTDTDSLTDILETNLGSGDTGVFAALMSLLGDLTPSAASYTPPSLSVSAGTAVTAGTVEYSDGTVGDLTPTEIEPGEIGYTATAPTVSPTEITAGAITASGISVSGSVSAGTVTAAELESPSSITAGTVAAVEIAAPTPVEADAVYAPTISTIGAVTAGAVAEPTAVNAADVIDNAVIAYAAQADLRHAQEEASLRASLFGSRAVMTTAFDNALAILAAHKQAQVTEYDKSVRVKQAEMQVGADMAHQQNLLEQRSRNAANTLDADKFAATMDLDVAKANAQLGMDESRENAALALDAAKHSSVMASDIAKANAQLALDAAREDAALTLDADKYSLGARIDVARTNAQLAVDADSTSAQLALDAAKTNAAIDFDAAKANAQFDLEADSATARLALEAARATAENALEADRATGQFMLQNEGMSLDAAKAEVAASVEVARVNAELALDAAKATAGFNIQNAANMLEKSRAQAQVDVQADTATAQIALEAARATVDAGLRSAEYALRETESNLRAEVAMAELGAGLIRAIYDTTVSWMQARSGSMAGAVAGLISGADELRMKGEEADRNAYVGFLNYTNEAARSISAGYEGVAQLRWKAMLQNIMVLKEGVSAFQGIGGVEHHPSGFDKVAQGASLAMGGVSSLINLGMVLG